MPKTIEEIIDETVNFYGEDVSRRAAIFSGGMWGCMYVSSDGRKCAFGRCMINPYLREDNHTGFNKNISVQYIKHHDTLLKEEYHGHPIGFWLDLQELHDINQNWNDNGISEWGTKEALRMKEVWVKTV